LTRFFWANFFSLLLVFVALAEWVCAAWLVSNLGGLAIPGWLHLIAPAAIYLLNRSVVTRALPPPGPGLTARRAYTGVAFTCVFGFLFLIIAGVTWAVVWSVLYATGLVGSVIHPETYGLVWRVGGTVVLLVVAAVMAWGYGIGSRHLWVNRLEVPVAGLGAAFDGKTIAQISDIHLGQFMTAERISGYVDDVNCLDADMIMITGDITDGLHHAHETFPALARLSAQMGVFAILGNHDVATGADDVIAALRLHTDFTVLCDDSVSILGDGAGFDLIGLMDRGRDWARGHPECDVLADLWARAEVGRPKVVLSHRPDLFAHAASLGAALVLSGHTHGGQLSIPYGRTRRASIARFMTRYPRGTYREGESWLHVNLGLGVTGQPVRVATPREITLITLRAAAP
jgi:predicted MPP superfamily phosphohydrolase